MAAADGDAKTEFFRCPYFVSSRLYPQIVKCRANRVHPNDVCLEDVQFSRTSNSIWHSKCVIYQFIPKVRMEKLHPSSGCNICCCESKILKKMIMESLLPQLGNPSRSTGEIETGNVDIVYRNAEQWLSDRWKKALRCGNLHRTKVLVSR